MQTPPTYGFEPTLADTLDDPIIQQLMMSDGVSRADVLHLKDFARESACVHDWPERLLANRLMPH